MIMDRLKKATASIFSRAVIVMMLAVLTAAGSAFAAKQKIVFSYDAAGTLKSAAYGPENTVTYVYDDGGNLLQSISKSGVDLEDAIVILQAIAGSDFPEGHRRIDVNYNSKAGLEEVIYILRRLAE